MVVTLSDVFVAITVSVTVAVASKIIRQEFFGELVSGLSPISISLFCCWCVAVGIGAVGVAVAVVTVSFHFFPFCYW